MATIVDCFEGMEGHARIRPFDLNRLSRGVIPFLTALVSTDQMLAVPWHVYNLRRDISVAGWAWIADGNENRTVHVFTVIPMG